MTANLETMMKFRDLQVAEDFAKMVELGYMEQEFAVYGCAYVKEGKRWYYTREDDGRARAYQMEMRQQGCYPTGVQLLQKTCQVPLGQQEAIAWALKRQLAQAMQADYPLVFLTRLNEWGEKPNTDSAYEIMAEMWSQAASSYDAGVLQCFAGLLALAFKGKVLSQAHHAYFR